MSEITTVKEAIEAAPEGTETFYSIHRGLQLLRQRTVATVHPATGNKVVHVEPVVYKFEPLGVLHVEHGQDMLPDGPGGAMQDAVAWLTSHPRLNRRFQWEGHEAGRPLPLEEDYLGEVTQATAHGDLKALRTLESEEEESHQRPLLLNTVRNAIAALEAQPAREPEPEALPDDYDRDKALAWLAEMDVVVDDAATDLQVLAIARQTAASMAEDDAA